MAYNYNDGTYAGASQGGAGLGGLGGAGFPGQGGAGLGGLGGAGYAGQGGAGYGGLGGAGLAGQGGAGAGFGGLGGAGQQQLGSGYGQRYLAAPEVSAQLAGRPPFFDSERGVQWDGRNAWFYDNSGASGARNSWSTGSVITAIEQTPTGTVIRIGNGTAGNVEEHRAHPQSVYFHGLNASL